MFENVAKLAPTQLGVRRHRRKAAVPNAMDGLDVFDAILGDDGDAIARLKTESAQRVGKPRGSRGERAVALRHAPTVADRGRGRMAQARAMKPCRDVHARNLDRVQPAEMDRIPLAPEQRHRLVEWQ